MRQVAPAPLVIETVEVVILPSIDDKISVVEHKNGEDECLENTGEQDNESREREESINGSEMVSSCIEDGEVIISQE
jgi:hypothetical protein